MSVNQKPGEIRKQYHDLLVNADMINKMKAIMQL